MGCFLLGEDGNSGTVIWPSCLRDITEGLWPQGGAGRVVPREVLKLNLSSLVAVFCCRGREVLQCWCKKEGSVPRVPPPRGRDWTERYRPQSFGFGYTVGIKDPSG